MSTAFPAIVTTDWLDKHLQSTAEDIRLLDVTWYSAKDAHEDYLKRHISGSGWFNVMHGAVHDKLFPRNLPDPQCFQQYARSFGISSSTHVVVYDSQGQAGYFIGARAWWMFKLHGHEKVSVLDGGLDKWMAEKRPTVQEIPSFQEGTFTVDYKESVKKTYEDMMKNVEDVHLQVCDSRASDKFASGHYPRAVNIPFADQLLDKENNTLKSEEALKAVFTDACVSLDKPLVAMCTSGISSCSLMLAAYLCGNRHCSIYLGGFNEWKQRSKPEHIVSE